MALTLNTNAQEFVPGWERNPNADIQQVDSQLEYNDAFLEYAYQHGLWGLPGTNYEPSENEITSMRQQFADHWINIHGYNEDIDYYGEEDHDDYEDIFFPENEEDGGDAMSVDEGGPTMDFDENDYSDEQVQVLSNVHCAECGIAEGENVILESDEDGERYCQGCWDEYENRQREPSTMNWSDIAIDFQEYCEYHDIFYDRLPGEVDFLIVENAWDQYVDDTFDEEYRPWAYVLADSNDWVGVFTPRQTEEVRAYRLQ